jgi:hypothetical protein
MDSEEILRELAHPEGLPEKALKAASSQRVEMLPVFLNEIDTCLAQHSVHRQTRHYCSSFSICSGSGGKRPLTGP